MLEQRFHHLRQPHLDPFRPGDDQRPAAARELRVEQQERQSGEMIAVEMRDQDQIDIVARDAEPLQCRQRRGAAIDQEIDVFAADMKAGVVPAAGPERVAAADKLQLHRSPLRFSRLRGVDQTKPAASTDSAAPAIRRARHSAPAARPTARHCRTSAATASGEKDNSDSSIRLRMSRAQVAPI